MTWGLESVSCVGSTERDEPAFALPPPGAVGCQAEYRKPARLPWPWLRLGQGSPDRSSRHISSICLPVAPSMPGSLLALCPHGRTPKDANRRTGALGRPKASRRAPRREASCLPGPPWGQEQGLSNHLRFLGEPVAQEGTL